MNRRHLPVLSNDFDGKRKLNLNFFSYEKAGQSLLVNSCLAIAKKLLKNNSNLIIVNQDLIDTQILGFYFY